MGSESCNKSKRRIWITGSDVSFLSGWTSRRRGVSSSDSRAPWGHLGDIKLGAGFKETRASTTKIHRRGDNRMEAGTGVNPKVYYSLDDEIDKSI